MPPIYVISLQTNTKRMERLEKHLAERELNAKQYPALDGYGLSLACTEFYQEPGGVPHLNTPGHVALCLSWMAVARHCLLSRICPVIICEDDVEFVPDFEKRFNELVIPDITDMILLGYCCDKDRQYQMITGNLAKFEPHPLCTEAVYFHSLRGLEMVASLPKINQHVDLGFLHYIYPKLNVLSAKPKLARQLSFDGEIERSI